MKKNPILLSAMAFCLVFASCKKDGSGFSTDITGDWTFESIHAVTYAESINTLGPDIYKNVTTSDYTTINNSGTAAIDGSNITMSNTSYAVNTIAHTNMYENGVLVDTFSMPMSMALPTFSGTTAYTRVNNDSVYFSNGFIMGGGSTGAVEPSGARIKIENGKLYIMSSHEEMETPASGVTNYTKADATIIYHR